MSSEFASRYEEPGEPELLSLDEAARARAAKVFEGLSEEGFRALGVAWRELDPTGPGQRWPTNEIWFLPASSSSSIRQRRAQGRPSPRLGPSGVGVKILSGDNERGDAACLHRTRHSDHRVAHRHRDRSARRRSARRAAGGYQPVLPGHAGSKEPRHPRVEHRGHVVGFSATASTTRRRCILPMSASPSIARSMSPRTRPTSFCCDGTSAFWSAASPKGAAPSATS